MWGAVIAAPSSRLDARWTIRRVLIPRCAFCEKRRSVKDLIAPETPFNHNIDTVRERVGSNAAIYNAVCVRAVRHPKRRLTPAWFANYRTWNHASPDFDASAVKRGIAGNLAGKLRWCEIIRRRLTDGTRHQIASSTKNQCPASQEFCGCFHSLQYKVCPSRLLKNSDGDREAPPIEVIKSLPGQ